MARDLQKRRLGRTNLWVSCVGFGGMWIPHISLDEAKRVVRKAYELGINYFDTAKGYGDSEEKIGAALEDVRDECIIATKTGSRTRRESTQDIEQSLRRLRTDRLDLIQLHGIDDSETLKKAMGGSLETCKEARSKGLADFIGISSHKPRVLVEAIKTGEFDACLVPFSFVTRQALDELIPLAGELGIGVAVMKPLAAKTSVITTWKYKESLSLLSDTPDLKTLLGKDKDERARTALRYVLAQDISVVVPGLGSVREVEVAVRVGEEFEGLTEAEKRRFSVELGNYCRDCGLCLPCPERLDIAAVLRFHTMVTAYGLREWPRTLYRALSVKAESCTRCGECEPKCPYGLPIIEMLRRAGDDLRQR